MNVSIYLYENNTLRELPLIHVSEEGVTVIPAPVKYRDVHCCSCPAVHENWTVESSESSTTSTPRETNYTDYSSSTTKKTESSSSSTSKNEGICGVGVLALLSLLPLSLVAKIRNSKT